MRIQLFKSEGTSILIEFEFLIEVLDDYLLLGLYDEYETRVEVLGPFIVEIFNQLKDNRHFINSMLEKKRLCKLLNLAIEQGILPRNKKIDSEIMNLEICDSAFDQMIIMLDGIQEMAVFCGGKENEYLKNFKIRLCKLH